MASKIKIWNLLKNCMRFKSPFQIKGLLMTSIDTYDITMLLLLLICFRNVWSCTYKPIGTCYYCYRIFNQLCARCPVVPIDFFETRRYSHLNIGFLTHINVFVVNEKYARDLNVYYIIYLYMFWGSNPPSPLEILN